MSQSLPEAPKRRRLGVFVPPRPPLDVARDAARGMDELAARTRFAAEGATRALKTTVSLCPDCLAYVPAFVFERRGKVWVKKACDTHGLAEAVLENDARYYFLSNKDVSGNVFAKDRVFDIPTFPGAEGCCDGGACEGTDQNANKTCTVLVEVTDACNLACPVCYSDAKGDRKLPFDAFCSYLEALIATKGGLDSVQLTGGEAMLHPEFWEMLAFVSSHPKIKKVYLPTNGLLLRKPGVMERLAEHKAKLMVLLQFDGTRDEIDETLRGATPGRARREVLERLGELGVFMQLTMTLTKGTNETDVGNVVAHGLAHEHVKVIALQPATYSGRYDLEPDPRERLTLSDIVKAVVGQTGPRGKSKESDFVPIPCSHPNCGWITLYLRRFGVVSNIVRFVDLPKIKGDVAYRTLLSTSDLQNAVGTGGGVLRRTIGKLGKRLVRSEDMFTVAIKPFMDRHSYDQDRIDHCCHHLLDTNGVARSFCEYNALLRPKDPWTRFPTV